MQGEAINCLKRLCCEFIRDTSDVSVIVVTDHMLGLVTRTRLARLVVRRMVRTVRTVISTKSRFSTFKRCRSLRHKTCCVNLSTICRTFERGDHRFLVRC